MTADEDEKLQKKRRFYDTFTTLEKSDEECDAGYQASKAKLARSRKPLVQLGSPIRLTDKQPSRARGIEGPKLPLNRASIVVQPTTTKATSAVVPIPTGPPPTAIPRTTSKRKGQETIKLAPEAQRIFTGLHFYFFPCNDANIARRLRITKALEYGASWQKDWNRFVTHVIMDINLDYASLLSFLRLAEIPDTTVVVNESWPAECLTYRALLDPSRTMFTVRGLPVRATAAVDRDVQHQPVLSLTSEDSLVLKTAGKAVRAKAPTTPDVVAESLDQAATASPGVARPVGEPHAQFVGVDDNVASLPEEFRALITQARELMDLPLEDEDPDDRHGISSTATRHEDVPLSPTAPAPPAKKVLTDEDNFQCMTAHTKDNEKGPNAEVISILQKMADYYGQNGDEWRVRAYRKAIAVLRNLQHKIVTKEQALALPHVGKRLADKIEEIVFTHRLRRLDHAQSEPSDQALQLFLKVYGAGYAQASEWVRAGHRTLDDLMEKAKLNRAQKVGVEHFEDFNLRIPRAEIEEHAAVVRQCLEDQDPNFTLTIGGSYRRGAADSGDIDCVITHPSWNAAEMREVITNVIVKRLRDGGFITAVLSDFAPSDGSQWHGASCLKHSKVWRRLDLLLVPAAELGAAMIYYTGNEIFNRSIRLWASREGFRLNQHGLFKDVIRGKNRERVTKGTLVEARDERKIFEILRVPWREPHERLI